MLFNSYAFLIFLPIVVILYWLLPHRFRYVMLLVASYYFYMSWNPSLVFLILGTTLLSYVTGLIIGKSKKRSVRLTCLLISVIGSLSVLFFFKYFNFLSESVTALIRSFGLPCGSLTFNLILPVGISFYTFQTLSYTIDIYRGKIAAERHFGYYALFVSFFPQLVAGPIERPGDLIPQLKTETRFKTEDFKCGIKYLLVGFFKKVVVADTLAVYVNSVFNNPSDANGFSVLLATVMFAVQILCDFDGYTNIAIGVGKMMGIHLTKNFNNPYAATNIKMFWRGWHITLTSWLTEYVYIPLGGSRCHRARHMLNIFITFLLSGLWHGANWTFVLWGITHGVYQIVGILTQKPRDSLKQKMGIDSSSRGWQAVQRIITFALVCFAWIIFRANSITDLGILLGKLFTDWNITTSYMQNTFAVLGLTVESVIFVITAVILLYLICKTFIDSPTLTPKYNGAIGAQSVASVKTALMGLLVAIVIVGWIYVVSQTGYTNAFIYFQF